jgi:hypothetical protein
MDKVQNLTIALTTWWQVSKHASRQTWGNNGMFHWLPTKLRQSCVYYHRRWWNYINGTGFLRWGWVPIRIIKHYTFQRSAMKVNRIWDNTINFFEYISFFILDLNMRASPLKRKWLWLILGRPLVRIPTERQDIWSFSSDFWVNFDEN